MAGKKQKLPLFWVRVQELASRPKRKRMGVNLGKISRNTKAGQTAVVCDKVLSPGKLSHAVTVAAPAFSAVALKAIKAAGGKTTTIADAMKANPTGKDFVILA